MSIFKRFMEGPSEDVWKVLDTCPYVLDGLQDSPEFKAQFEAAMTLTERMAAVARFTSGDKYRMLYDKACFSEQEIKKIMELLN